jgi:hypothetical protein
MIAEQEYHRAGVRRHNRLLHGWGVVCGAWVRLPQEQDADPSVVVVEPGFVLGPQGDEILIDAEVSVNVFEEDLAGNAVPCSGTADPWCATVRPQRPVDQPVYLAVRYAECPTTPVRAAAGGCGCGCSGECEYSRIRDGFVIKVLNELPSSYRPLPGHAYPDFTGSLWCDTGEAAGRRSCPTCPTDPWVILAELRLTGNAVGEVRPLAQRRFTASFGDYYYTCSQDGGHRVSEEGAAPAALTQPAGANAAAGQTEKRPRSARQPARRGKAAQGSQGSQG